MGRGLPTLAEEPKAERKGRSATKVCTRADGVHGGRFCPTGWQARKIGDPLVGGRGAEPTSKGLFTFCRAHRRSVRGGRCGKQRPAEVGRGRRASGCNGGGNILPVQSVCTNTPVLSSFRGYLCTTVLTGKPLRKPLIGGPWTLMGKLIGSSHPTSPRSPISGLRRASKRPCSAIRATGARALPRGRDQPLQRSMRPEILFPVIGSNDLYGASPYFKARGCSDSAPLNVLTGNRQPVCR